MIVSDTHNFIFIHNPKCAGTSIRNILAKYDTYNGKFWRNLDNRLPRRDMAHMELRYLKEYYPNIFHKMKTYFVFGFVRDPLKRLVSGFNETHKDIYQGCLRGDLEPICSYKNIFVDYCLKILASSPASYPFTHTVPQHLMFYLENKCHADLIIKIETISQISLRRLSPFIHEPYLDLAKHMLNGRKSNQKPFPLTLNELVGSAMYQDLKAYYMRDIELFEY